MSDLTEKTCTPCEGGTPPLKPDQTNEYLRLLKDWEQRGDEIRREFSFKNYYETIAFVNAIAWISNRENHHPDLEVGYNKCIVRYSTHAIGGLSENDFICAAKVDALLK